MEDMEKPWAQKLEEEKERDNYYQNGDNEDSKKNVEDMRVPHLTNLNEDP